MSTTKVWNLMYALGNTSRVVGDPRHYNEDREMIGKGRRVRALG